MNSDTQDFLSRQHQAILATIRKDGRPQLSNVLSVFYHDTVLVSITETRAKYKNLVRDPRASLLVLGENFWRYLVVDGRATLIHLPEAQSLLRTYYELATGKPHANWEEYDQAMRDERRVILQLSIDRTYP